MKDPESAQKSEAHQIIQDKEFLSSLLVYLDSNSPIMHRWQPPQLKELQIHALQILGYLINIIPEHFNQREGNSVLISFLSNYSDYERRISVLKCLLNCSEFDDAKIDFSEKGIMDILLYII